jgi:pimeloyl-ACP methyl ester carboxylesterase
MTILAQGSRLFGGLYLARSDAPAPAVILLHGLPGHERNLDLAQSLRGLGMHVLFFSYRGAWGSEGKYSLHHCIPDALAALDAARAHPLIDPTRLGLVGLSLGGWAALAAAAVSPESRAVVAMAPLLDPRRPMGGVDLDAALAAEFARPLRGIEPAQLVREWGMLAPLEQLAPALAARPILLVTAGRDELFPPAHYAGVRALLPQVDWVTFPRADHVFSDVRPGLCHTVGAWLLDHLV